VQSAGEARHAPGFALIIVLWTLVLLAFIGTQLVASGRVEIRIASNLTSNAVTAAAADGAAYQAIFNLLDPQADRRWPLDGTAHDILIGDCDAVVRLDDESARINPNLASPALLEALLRVTGSDSDSAHRLAAAIAEWTGTAAALPTQDALQAEYSAAGRDYAPPEAPLETLAELREVLGLTPQTLVDLRPHLSLFAPAVPNLAHADPLVAAAVAAALQGAPPQSLRAPGAQSDLLTARIEVEAHGPGHARATRLAIVQIVPAASRYTILAWDRAEEE
jgi:general secretion pathway protein K